MTLRRPCIDCGTPTNGTRCPLHQREADARRHAKQKAHGRNTARWRQLRRQAIARDGGRCTRCGKPGRSVHLHPSLKGRHDLATLIDCTTLCASCHGTVDAPRVQPTNRFFVDEQSARPATVPRARLGDSDRRKTA